MVFIEKINKSSFRCTANSSLPFSSIPLRSLHISTYLFCLPRIGFSMKLTFAWRKKEASGRGQRRCNTNRRVWLDSTAVGTVYTWAGWRRSSVRPYSTPCLLPSMPTNSLGAFPANYHVLWCNVFLDSFKFYGTVRSVWVLNWVQNTWTSWIFFKSKQKNARILYAVSQNFAWLYLGLFLT